MLPNALLLCLFKMNRNIFLIATFSLSGIVISNCPDSKSGLICFKVKFLKSLKPQNAASSFFDFDVVQKAKICFDTVDDSDFCLSARFSNGINLLDLRTRL